MYVSGPKNGFFGPKNEFEFNIFSKSKSNTLGLHVFLKLIVHLNYFKIFLYKNDEIWRN